MDFLGFPPEINSALMYAGAGSGPLFMAAAAWDGLAADLHASAASFDSVISALTGGPAGTWSGPSSLAMAAAAAPYVAWLASSAAQAEAAAAQARVAATAFETAQTATVHPAAVTANRVLLGLLVATNFLGQNTPAIAATEFDYVEMWAQDVAAMLGYHGGATAVAATLTPFSLPPVDLAGLAAQVGSQVAAAASVVGEAVAPVAPGAADAVSTVVGAVQSLASGASLQSFSTVAQLGTLPVSLLMSPLMSLTQGANGAGLAGTAATGLAADVPKLVGDTAPAMSPLGGVGGLGGGAGMAADLGKARLVGSMSVPPTWPGSMPKAMAASALSGLGAVPNAAAMAQGAGAAGGGMPMMPMPIGMGGGAAGMPPGMMGRGGAGSHVVQNRPSVIPRTGVG